jgi:hypothetical protein
VTSLRVEELENYGSGPDKGTDFILALQSVQTVSDGHPDTFSIGTGEGGGGCKAAET